MSRIIMMINNTKEKMLHCAIGVVQNKNNQILISQRPLHKTGGGFWEFPGGKVEPLETAEEALLREIKEEVGIIPIVFEPLIQFPYDYPNYRVLLDVFLIKLFEGSPKGLERQNIAWVNIPQLKDYAFLEANDRIIHRIIEMPILENI